MRCSLPFVDYVTIRVAERLPSLEVLDDGRVRACGAPGVYWRGRSLVAADSGATVGSVRRSPGGATGLTLSGDGCEAPLCRADWWSYFLSAFAPWWDEVQGEARSLSRLDLAVDVQCPDGWGRADFAQLCEGFAQRIKAAWASCSFLGGEAAKITRYSGDAQSADGETRYVGATRHLVLAPAEVGGKAAELVRRSAELAEKEGLSSSGTLVRVYWLPSRGAWVRVEVQCRELVAHWRFEGEWSLRDQEALAYARARAVWMACGLDTSEAVYRAPVLPARVQADLDALVARGVGLLVGVAERQGLVLSQGDVESLEWFVRAVGGKAGVVRRRVARMYPDERSDTE